MDDGKVRDQAGLFLRERIDFAKPGFYGAKGVGDDLFHGEEVRSGV